MADNSLTLYPYSHAGLPEFLNNSYTHDNAYYHRHDPAAAVHRLTAALQINVHHLVGHPQIGIIMWDPADHDSYWHSTWQPAVLGLNTVTCDAQFAVYYTFALELRAGDWLVITSFKVNSVDKMAGRHMLPAEANDSSRMMAALSYLERNDGNCLICWSPLVDNRETPCCGSFFCLECLKKWSAQAAGTSRCPNCSLPFEPSDCTHNVSAARATRPKAAALSPRGATLGGRKPHRGSIGTSALHRRAGVRRAGRRGAGGVYGGTRGRAPAQRRPRSRWRQRWG